VWTPRLEQVITREAETFGISFEEARRRRLGSMPLGRFVETAEVADLAVFLCSERAGAIAGQAIGIDGAAHDDVNY
jgi:NAD(P)-dependent dehydrogenase (short-subunit alcohol dehydrogenase family)